MATYMSYVSSFSEAYVHCPKLQPQWLRILQNYIYMFTWRGGKRLRTEFEDFVQVELKGLSMRDGEWE
jgi:hypothetical protein